MTLRTVIVDDEPLALRKLVRLLGERTEVGLVGEARNGVEAVAMLEQHRPDLVLLDVEMPQVDGFQVLDAVETPPAHVVFVTAHDRYAVQAFEVEATHFLLKPVDPDRLNAALDRVLQRAGRSSQGQGRAQLAEIAPRGVKNLLVRRAGRLRVISVDSVELIESDGNYVEIYTGTSTFSMRTSLQALHQRLDPSRFVRIHRARIVRLNAVAELVPAGRGDFDVRLASGRCTRWSRRYRDAAKGLLID